MKLLIRILPVFATAFLVMGCYHDYNDRVGCDGSIKLINPIPDTTVIINLDTLVIDLSGGEKSAFKHTGGKLMEFNFMINGGMSASVTYKNRQNPNEGMKGVVRLKEIGTFNAIVLAIDDCEKMAEDDFVITIKK